ncbi:hypothetical protein QE382_000370 [Sphingobacterium zeae]|uniref:CarboxypepD_reg-like domain-containing protein n=1 Tax=Sphingobacterium zeae TaxID=1776859 RepID=A0ABU0U0A1_9SPHI|nr:hypothetical protein [Sphingobacterium zeae]MDQ1148386.1 hypothetical protein [Sphingobacterium zeae]
MEKMILQVKESCSAEWNNMSLQEQGRFCSQCEKIVVDFSQMNDQEIVDQIKKAGKGLCGRFYEDQLMRELDATLSFSKNPIWRGRWTRIAAGLMLVGSMSFQATQAQNKLTGEVIVVQTKPKKDKIAQQGRSNLSVNDEPVLKGNRDNRKVSIRGKVVCAGSDVSMLGTEVTLGSYHTEADEKGYFQLWIPKAFFQVDQELRAQMIGYKTVVIPIKKGGKVQLDKPVEMEFRPMIMGKITVPKTKDNIQRRNK